MRGNRRLGFEFKHTDAPGVTKSMRIAHQDQRLDELVVVHAGEDSYPLGAGIRAVPCHACCRTCGRCEVGGCGKLLGIGVVDTQGQEALPFPVSDVQWLRDVRLFLQVFGLDGQAMLQSTPPAACLVQRPL